MADNKSVIREFVEQVLNQGRFELLDELVLEDFVEPERSAVRFWACPPQEDASAASRAWSSIV